MPDKSVDAVITDPPYGINYKYSSGYEDTRESLINLISGLIPNGKRIAERMAVFCGVNNLQIYPEADWTISWNWRGTNTYGKLGYNQWQPILVYGKDIKGFGSVNGILKSDSIPYEGGNCDEKKNFAEHSCPKNIGIMKKIICRLSSEGDTILDPFMGSGTTGVACVQTGRNFIGIEIDPGYFKIAEKRIHDAQQQMRLF